MYAYSHTPHFLQALNVHLLSPQSQFRSYWQHGWERETYLIPTLFPSISLDTPGPTICIQMNPRFCCGKSGKRTRNNDAYAFMAWNVRGHGQVAADIVDIGMAFEHYVS